MQFFVFPLALVKMLNIVLWRRFLEVLNQNLIKVKVSESFCQRFCLVVRSQMNLIFRMISFITVVQY